MIFCLFPIFELFWQIFYHNFRSAQPNLIIFSPIDRFFDYSSVGKYKILKFKKNLYETFQKTRPMCLTKSSTGSTQLGTPKTIFWKALLFYLYFDKKL